MKFLKVTIIGGIVFLVPITVLLMIFSKIVNFLAKLATPLAAWLPVDRVGGVALADLVAIFGIIVLCFLAGLVARSRAVTRSIRSLETRFLYAIPGYSFVKSMAGSVVGAEDSKTLTPVIASFDDASQVAFKVESLADGRVVVFIPGAPNPWDGSLFIMTADRVEPLERSLAAAVKHIRGLGAGAKDFIGAPAS